MTEFIDLMTNTSYNNNNNNNNDKFNVMLIGDYDEDDGLFSKIFPIKLNDSNIKHKYINRFDLCIIEEIKFSYNSIDIFSSFFIDKLMNIDILILTYNLSNNLSFEYLKNFYYLYYNKLEEKDKPKYIILIEFDSFINDEIYHLEKIDKSNVEQLKLFFNGYFFKYEDNEEKLDEILNECANNLIKSNDFIEDYTIFEYKELEKEINIVIVIFGDIDLQNSFIKLFLESKFIFDYKKNNNDIYEIKYEKINDNKKFNFKIILKLIKNENYHEYDDSECNILLYDINKEETYNKIKNIIREFILKNGAKIKKIFNIFSLNSNKEPITENENNNLIKKGKNLANEIGAYFSTININNNQNLSDEIKNKFENILEQIISCIINSKLKKCKNLKTITKDNDININKFDFVELKRYDSPLIYIKEIKTKVKNELKDNKINFLNICPKCFYHLNIRINEISNIIITFCDKCKSIPRGYNIEQFILNDKAKSKFFHCIICKKMLNYKFNKKQLYCNCQNKNNLKNIKNNNNTSGKDNIQIPFFLIDSYCNIHNKFHKYYYKYSKKGLCEDCVEEKKGKHLFENFDENKIDELIKQKISELKKESEFITSLQKKFNDCIKCLQAKFEKLIKNKKRIYLLKSDLINSLKIIKNNYTIISNIKDLKIDTGENFKYKEDDSIENKIQNIYNYLNYEKIDLNNLYFGKDNTNDNINYKGPYDNLINEEKEKETIITDICGIKNNQLICISFNNGQAKIFNLNINENNYPICIIKEFESNQGIHSLYVSNNEQNIWKINNPNKNDIIYLNGFEEIKIIQMNNNYESYNMIYIIRIKNSNILSSFEIGINSILILNNTYELKLIYINKEKNNEIKSEIKDVTELFTSQNKVPLSLNKISENKISLYLSTCNEFKFSIRESQNRITLADDESFQDKQDTKNDIDVTNYSRNGTSITTRDSYLRETINNYNENEKIIKLFYLSEDNTEKDNNNKLLTIKKHFMFQNNYELLGSISDEDNLLLLFNSLKDKNNIFEYELYIFDFNICQFINCFKINNILSSPKLFVRMNNDAFNNINFFFICDEDLNLYQYFYDKNYINKICYINNEKTTKKGINKPTKLINLYKEIILLNNNNDYYLLKY